MSCERHLSSSSSSQGDREMHGLRTRQKTGESENRSEAGSQLAWLDPRY